MHNTVHENKNNVHACKHLNFLIPNATPWGSTYLSIPPKGRCTEEGVRKLKSPANVCIRVTIVQMGKFNDVNKIKSNQRSAGKIKSDDKHLTSSFSLHQGKSRYFCLCAV